MRVIHHYILSSFLGIFAVALLLISFILSIGLIFKAVEVIAGGMSLPIVWKLISTGLPGTLTISIPISALISVLLLFGRLSSDSEISAMRACGIRLFHIMLAPLFCGVLMTGFCLYINSFVLSESNYYRHVIFNQSRPEDILALIRPGRTINDFPNILLYVGDKKGAELSDIRILNLRRMRNGRMQEIKAQSATLVTTDTAFCIEMRNVTGEPLLENFPDAGAGAAERLQYLIASRKPLGTFSDDQNERRVKDRDSLHLLKNAFAYAKQVRTNPENKNVRYDYSDVTNELSQRTVLALACVCFIAIGIPLAIKSHRKETSVGVALCIAITASFYFFIIAAASVSDSVWMNGFVIAWLPVFLCLGLSTYLVSRNP